MLDIRFIRFVPLLFVTFLLISACAQGDLIDTEPAENNDDNKVLGDNHRNRETKNSENENAQNRNSEDGNSEDENAQNGNSEDENSEDENSENGNSEDENSENGNSENGNSEDENSENGNSEDENSDNQNPCLSGALDFNGECLGDTLRYCREDEVISIDCIERAGRCGHVSPEYGYDCLLDPGEGCLYEGSSGVGIALCGGNAAGCVITGDVATCRTGVGTCDPAAPEVCMGDNLVIACEVNQPHVVNCQSLGGACDAALDACTNLPVGAECYAGLFECAPGLVCAGNTCQLPASECGSTDAFGQCNGTVLSYCDVDENGSDVLVEFDCAGLYPGATTVCADVSNGFHDCAVRPGDNCYYRTSTGDPLYALCSGPEPACVWGTSFSCVDNIGVCHDNMGHCLGNHLVIDCTLTQPFVIDCTIGGGTCSESTGTCAGIPAGGPCMAGALDCAPGLNCIGETSANFGTCN